MCIYIYVCVRLNALASAKLPVCRASAYTAASPVLSPFPSPIPIAPASSSSLRYLRGVSPFWLLCFLFVLFSVFAMLSCACVCLYARFTLSLPCSSGCSSLRECRGLPPTSLHKPYLFARNTGPLPSLCRPSPPPSSFLLLLASLFPLPCVCVCARVDSAEACLILFAYAVCMHACMCLRRGSRSSLTHVPILSSLFSLPRLFCSVVPHSRHLSSPTLCRSRNGHRWRVPFSASRSVYIYAYVCACVDARVGLKEADCECIQTWTSAQDVLVCVCGGCFSC